MTLLDALLLFAFGVVLSGGAVLLYFAVVLIRFVLGLSSSKRSTAGRTPSQSAVRPRFLAKLYPPSLYGRGRLTLVNSRPRPSFSLIYGRKLL